MNKEELKEEIIKVLREFKAECYNQSKGLTFNSQEDIINHLNPSNLSSIFSKMSDVFGLIDELDIAEGKGLHR